MIVEGKDDRIVLEKILPQMSESIKKAIQNGTLIIDDMGGQVTYHINCLSIEIYNANTMFYWITMMQGEDQDKKPKFKAC
mgnify:CR=1 FL=1